MEETPCKRRRTLPPLPPITLPPLIEAGQRAVQFQNLVCPDSSYPDYDVYVKDDPDAPETDFSNLYSDPQTTDIPELGEFADFSDVTFIFCNSQESGNLSLLRTDKKTGAEIRAAFARTYPEQHHAEHISMVRCLWCDCNDPISCIHDLVIYSPDAPFKWNYPGENPLLKYIPDLSARTYSLQRIPPGANIDAYGMTWNMPCYDWQNWTDSDN